MDYSAVVTFASLQQFTLYKIVHVYSIFVNNVPRIVVCLREMDVAEDDMVEEESVAQDINLLVFIPEPYLHYFPADVIFDINMSDKLTYYLMLVGDWGLIMGTH
jgi:hypothetical protein